MKLVLASDNKNKLREFRTLFENFGVELISKAESGFTEEVEETGETFAENARIKAEAVMRATGLGRHRGRFRPLRGRARRRAGRAFRALYRKPCRFRRRPL